MRKMVAMMMLVLALVGMIKTFGADMQTGRLVIANVTTNAVALNTGVVDVTGEIKLIQITVANADPFDLDITDAATGAVIFSANDVAANLTLLPRLALTGSAGTALTADGTNVIYGPVYALGLNVTAGAATAGTNTVTISVVVDKNP